MKRSLGNLLIAMIALPTCGWSVTYHWQLLRSPQTLRVDQSALVRYECRFDESAADYAIKLHPVDSASYKLTILREQNRVVKGKRIDTFDLVLTPKQSGTIPVAMEGVVEYVPAGAVDYNAHLGRDNVSKIDIVTTNITLPTFSFESKPNDAALTGKMTLEISADKTRVRAHEPLHLSIILKGTGNLEKFTPIEFNISGVKVFSESPQKQLSATSEGDSGEVRQEFALVSDKPYVIPPVSLNLFDTEHNRYSHLTTAPIPVEVEEGYDVSSLLDAPDLTNTATLRRYALYAGLIAFGAAAGEVLRRVWKYRPRRKNKRFWERARSSKELVMLLALDGDKRYDNIVSRLESGEIGLREAKKKLDKLTLDKKVDQ